MTTLPQPAGPARPQARPSLVPPKSITHELEEETECSNAIWARGDCEGHGTTRWIQLPCKRRFCPYCGYVRRAKIATRIDLGILALAGPRGAGYVCGTWATDPGKPQAVRSVSRLVAWLRRHQTVRPEYAITWEQTRKHVLHVNILLAPFRYVHQATLSHTWERLTGNPRIWVARVGTRISHEMAKSNRTPGWYFAKAEQMVATGRSCSYSKGWPKLPNTEHLPRIGRILWTPPFVVQSDSYEYDLFTIELALGHWYETAPGWYAARDQEQCPCFNLELPTIALGVDPAP